VNKKIGGEGNLALEAWKRLRQRRREKTDEHRKHLWLTKSTQGSLACRKKNLIMPEEEGPEKTAKGWYTQRGKPRMDTKGSHLGVSMSCSDRTFLSLRNQTCGNVQKVTIASTTCSSDRHLIKVARRDSRVRNPKLVERAP